jgi:hypothetical protein
VIQGEAVDDVARIVAVVKRDNKGKVGNHAPMVTEQPPVHLRIIRDGREVDLVQY